MPEATLPRAIEPWAKLLTENNELDEKPNTAASSLGKKINNCGKKSSLMMQHTRQERPTTHNQG
jgi:hypothetical protein